MKIMKRFLLICLVLLLIPIVHAPIFLGTCDGYILDLGGGVVSGANVTVSVNGCSGEGCVKNVLSDSGGYYVSANLNLDPGETVSVSAFKGSATGSNTGTADSFQAARVNVTLCEAPSSPSLIDQGDQHANNVTFFWTSGTDPNAYPTHDEFQLDSNPVVSPATSPKTETGLSYTAHTWKARTCNSGCCSSWASDTFTITNSAPSTTLLTDQGDTHDTNVTLSWTSGTDPEGDTTHDEFQFQSEAIVSPATSPVTKTGLVLGTTYTWRVRTCDSIGACSAWASDTFTVTNTFPSSPTLEDEPSTTSTTVSLNWASGADADADAVTDELQFSIYSDFSALLYDYTNATSPLTITNLSKFTTYYWRVRSCDQTGCSAWASDSFIVYYCSPCPVCPVCPSRGGGGGGIIYRPFCSPSWECIDWGPCIGGIARRECVDVNKCFELPEVARTCRIPFPPGLMPENYLGNLDEKDLFDKPVSFDTKWVFTFDGVQHMITILGITEDSAELLIESNSIILTINLYETRTVDINSDNIDDITLTLEEIKESSVTLTLIVLKPISRFAPLEKPIRILSREFGRLWLLTLVVYLIAILELIALVYIYKKYVRNP